MKPNSDFLIHLMAEHRKNDPNIALPLYDLVNHFGIPQILHHLATLIAETATTNPPNNPSYTQQLTQLAAHVFTLSLVADDLEKPNNLP